MTLQDLLNTLPNCQGPTKFPLRRGGSDLDYRLSGLSSFVAPNLAERPDVGVVSNPSVVIISAAGAVGKTTLGAQLAYLKKTLFWNLAESEPVGQKSLTGTLLSVFGVAQIEGIDAALRSGELFIVIDALDEARVKITEPGFDAFLSDLADYAKSGRGVKFLLLGRTLIAERVWLFLEIAGARPVVYSLEMFTRAQAEEYIDLRISTTWPDDYERIRQHRQPFVQARDLLFDHLRAAIAGREEEGAGTAENFLGYAPVLDAVATLLAGETNYGQLVSDLGDDLRQLSGTEERPVVLLRRIVETILEREHTQKILVNLRKQLSAAAKRVGWKDWDSLYSSEQQCRLLLSLIMGRHVEINPNLPLELREKFEEQLSTWLPDHPFLRDGKYPGNVVFESYLLARALTASTLGFLPDAEARMADAQYKPSHLLADFYLLFSEETDEKTVAAQHIGFLYEALMAAESDVLRVRLSLEGSDPDDVDVEEETEGEFELVYVRPGRLDEVAATRTFKALIRPDTRVTFSRQLREALIIIPCVLVLGTNAQEFTIGPRVDARCRSLEINAPVLIVSSDRGSGSGADTEADVLLEARAYAGSVGKRPITRGTLHVSWPGAEAFPWTEFRTEVDKQVFEDQQVRNAYRRFRRIVMTLQSHRRGGLARFRDKIEHSRVLQGTLGEALLGRLVTDGVLRLEGEHYFWVPATADRVVGISWHDLRLGRIGVTLNRYLQDFLAGLRRPHA